MLRLRAAFYQGEAVGRSDQARVERYLLCLINSARGRASLNLLSADPRPLRPSERAAARTCLGPAEQPLL